jgi:adenylate cyclase
VPPRSEVNPFAATMETPGMARGAAPKDAPPAPPPPPPLPEPSGGLSLKIKALLLFGVVALGAVGLTVLLLLRVNERAVKDSESQLQAVVLSEVAATATELVRSVQADTETVAALLGQAAAGVVKDDDAIESVRALLATRDTIEAVRFEVPSVAFSTVIRRAKGAAEVPASTPELRKAADEKGVGFAVIAPGQGLLVARVPTPPPAEGKKPVAGYVDVGVPLDKLGEALDGIAHRRFGGAVSLLIASADRKAVASYGVEGATPGASVASLPIWATLSPGTTWTAHVGVVSEHEQDGVKMVGAIESVPELGWGVAIWRPEPVAYAVLDRMRTQGAIVAAVASLLALLAGYLAARAVTEPIRRIVGEARLIGQRKWRDIRLADSPAVRRGDEIGELTRSLSRMSVDLEKGEAEILHEAKLRGDLSRFMSKQLVDAIVHGDHPLALGGKRAVVSVLFADVVAFTPLAEARSAEQVVALLNELFSVLTEVVFRHGGTVDKFIGDCVMAVWGAPVAQVDHAERALAAAEDMMRFLETANEGWRTKYDIEVRLGIGVNSGEAIVGNVGSDKRMEYTVIGDVVNVAARLEAIARPNQVLLAQATKDFAGDAFVTAELGERKLTGREKATMVYELETS